jgi:hypothetical protein
MIKEWRDNQEDSETSDASAMTTVEWADDVEQKLERLLELDTSDELRSRDHEILQNNFNGIPPELMELALNQEVSADPSVRASLIDVAKKHANVVAVCTREDLQDPWPDDEDEDAERIKIEVMIEDVLEGSTRTALRNTRSMRDD